MPNILTRALPMPLRRQLGRVKQGVARAVYQLTGRAPEWIKYDDPQGYWERRRMLDEDQASGAHSGRLTTEGREIFFRELAQEPPRLVLDAGCGYGRELKPMTERFPGARTIGVDFSYSALQDARRYAPGSGRLLVQASLDALPFKDGVFDATYSTGVLCSIPETVAANAFDELLRVTNGRIIHREIVRSHLVGAGRAELVERMDLAGHLFNHDYEGEYRRRGHAVERAEPLAPYRDQPPGGPQEIWYSLVVIRPARRTA